MQKGHEGKYVSTTEPTGRLEKGRASLLSTSDSHRHGCAGIPLGATARLYIGKQLGIMSFV